MRRPKVSIVTPSYNQADFIEWTLRSVLCQDYPDVEYIVMDSVSTDGTADVLRKYADAIDVLVVEKDKGQTDALDRAFRRATGDILGYLNSDDCFAGPRVLSEVVEAFSNHPDAEVIYGQRDLINEVGEYVTHYPYRPFDAGIFVEADYLPQEATFWTRRAYERAGGFMNTSFDFAMDYELFLRFFDQGSKFVAVPNLWGLFRWYPNQKSNAAWKNKGLPEIERLQRKYLGRPFDEQQMYRRFADHVYGANDRDALEAHVMFWHVWDHFVRLKKAVCGNRRLDLWVTHTPVNPARLGKAGRAA